MSEQRYNTCNGHRQELVQLVDQLRNQVTTLETTISNLNQHGGQELP